MQILYIVNGYISHYYKTIIALEKFKFWNIKIKSNIILIFKRLTIIFFIKILLSIII